MIKRFCLIITALLFVLSLGSSSFAQDKPKLNDRAKQRLETRLKNMTKEVGLKPDQVTKVEEILAEDAMAAPAIDRSKMRNMSREERMEMMQKRRENQVKINKKIEKLLTPDQVKKFKGFIEKENSQRRSRRGRRG